MFLKKIKFYVFSDINIKINIIKNFNNSKKKIKNRFNTDNYKLNFKKLDLINYLKFFEVYGEFVLKSKLSFR
jgi:maltooligosyltrehalose synthase